MMESLYINWKKEKLALSIDYPEDFHLNQKYPLIIICHGFIGSRIGVDRLFVKTAEVLKKEKFIVIRFDFSGCGESTGDYGTTGLSAFISQTKAIIDYAYNLKYIDKSDITLLGHSLGGATAVLTSAHDQRINKLILWSAVAKPSEDIKRIVGKEKVRSLNKVLYIDYSGYQLKKEFFDSLACWNPLESASQFKGDVLILHGTGDEEIPVTYAGEYNNHFNSGLSLSCEKWEIEDANHTISNSSHFLQLIDYTQSWLRSKATDRKRTALAQ